MSLPKPNDKKSTNGLPILDASFNAVQSTQKQSPTIPTKSSGGLPVIDSSYNQFIEKKNVGNESVTTSLTQSESPSQSELPERESPTSFLSNDIEQTQLFSTGDVPAFDPRSLAEPVTPSLPSGKKEVNKEAVLSDVNELGKYINGRFSSIDSEIKALEEVRSNELDKIKINGGDYFTPDNAYEAAGRQIKEKKDYLNKLRNSSAAQVASLILPKYLENPTAFNPKELGRELVRASSPDLESKFQLVENEGKPIPGIQSADLEKTGIDLMKSYVGDYKFPPKEQIDAANASLAEMDSRLAANPTDISLKNRADVLRKELEEVNNIQKMKQQISVYEKDFEEKNYELTWSTVKDKLGAYFHANDDSGVFGYNTEKLMQAVNDPAVGLTAGEKAVALNYGIPLESKLLGTDIPGSGLVRSFKNAVEQSVTGTWKTIASESNKRLRVNLGRTEADQASELLNEETGGSRFRSVGDNPRATSELSALRAKETSGQQLNDNEKSRKVELQKYVDVRTNWDKVKDLTGNMTGQVAAIAAVAKGVGGIGNVASKVGTSLGATASGLTSSTIGSVLSNEFGGLFISSYLFAKDGYDKQAIDLMPGEDQAAARDSYSSLMSGFEAATEMIFRDTKFLDGFMGKLSPNLAKVTKSYINGNITSQAARDEINSFISKYVKSAGKEFVTSIYENATEESGIDILQGVTNAGFGIEDWDLYKTGTKAVDTFVSTAISSGIIGSMAGHGAYRKANNQSRFMKATVADMSVNPAKYLRSVEELQTAGEISQQQANDKIKIIKSSSKFLGELPATREVPVVDNDGNEVVVSKKFDYPEATSYVLHRLNEGILTEKLDATTDPIEQSVLKKQISQSEKIRKGIYEGKIGVTPNIDPVSNNPEEAQELGILSAEAVSSSDLIGTPFKKETPTEAGVTEVSVNEKEQAAIEGLQNKDFANSPVKPYTDVIQNPDASIEDKKEALKGLSDQLTAKGTEITVGEALGKEADLIYDLGYEPAQESEAIREVTEGAASSTPLLDKFKEKKRKEAQQFDEAAAEKGVSVVRPSAVTAPNVVGKTATQNQPDKSGAKISVIAPSQNKSPQLVSEIPPEVIEVSQIIDQELVPNGVEGKQAIRDSFKNEMKEDYDEELVDAAYDLYTKRVGGEATNVAPEPATEATPVAEEEAIELTPKEKLASEKSLPSYRAKYSGATQEEYQANRVSGTQKKDKLKAQAVQPKVSGVTQSKIINDGYNNIKNKIGERGAKKYFEQVDRLFNPNQNEIVEYRENGVVTKEGDKYIFHALSDMDLKTWRISFKRDVSDQFTEKKASVSTKESIAKPESTPEPKAQQPEEPKPKKKSPSKKKLTSIEDVENELRDLFAMDRMVGIPVGEKTNSIEQYLEKSKAVLSQLYPDATITTYDTAEEYYDKEGRPVGSAGVFHPQEQRLALNLELIAEHGAENTIFHEVIHPIVNEAILSKEGALDDVFDQLKSLKDIPGMDAVHEHIQAYAGRGINIQKVEGITEFLTQVADGKIDLANVPEKSSSKVIDLINKIFEALGISLRISTATDLKRLSDAIKTSFDNADASAVSELIGRRKSSAGVESVDAILPEEQERIIKDIISRSEGIPQDKLKEAIKKYTGWSDEKVDSFFGNEKVPAAETGERKFTTRVSADEEIAEPTRKQIKENLDYVRRANAISAKEASDILAKVGEEEAYDIVVNDRDIAPATRVVLGQALIKKFNQLAIDSKDPEEKERYHQRTVNIADFVAERLGTIPGQMIQALSLYSRLTPEAQIMKAVKEKKKDSQHKRDKAARRASNITDKISKVNAETADEITSSKKISKAVDDAKKRISEKATEKIERARKRRQQIKDKYKSEKGTSLYSGVGLTKEGIEYVGNIAKTYIDEGVAELSIIIDNVLNDLKDLTSKAPNEEVIKNVNDIVFSQFQSRRDDVIAENLKDLEATVGRIVKEHYTVKESEKRSLVDKFVENAGLPQEEAKKLADEVSEEFDRIATRKKTAILDQEKKQFNQIKKILDTWNKTSAERLANDIIKYTNLGAFDRGDLIDMLAKKIGTGQLTPEEIKKIRELAERVEKAPEGSPKTKATEDLLAYQADLKGTSWAEVGQAIWYANVLSGVSTHLKNIISTFFNGAAYFATQSVRDPRSIPFLFKGGVSGTKRGFFEAIHTATTGETPIHVRAIDVPDVLERKNFYGGIFNPVTYLKYVSRMMKAEDVFQFQILKEMRATQLAYKEARKLGYKNSFSNSTWRKVDELLLNTKERIDEATKEAQAEGLTGSKLDRRVYELMELSRPIQMTEDAYGFAAKGTFNHDTEGTLGALNDLASRMLDFSVGGAKPLRFIVPFTRILTNVLNNAIDFSPLGYVRWARKARGFKSFGKSVEDKYHVMSDDERADVFAKASLATAITLGLYILTKIKGDDDEPLLEITGGGTGDYRKDAQLRQSGWQPYSVKIGDNYYSYALTPLAISLGLVGNINDHEKYSKGADEEELYQKVTLAAWQWAKLATDMTWIGSTSSFMGALDASNPVAMEKAVSNNLKNTSKSFLIPNIYSQTAQEYQRIFNLPQKQTNGFYEQLIQDVPIARNSLNDKINALGDPIIRDTDLMISEKTVDPTLKLLMDKKAWVSPITKNSFIVYDKEKKLERVGTDDEYYLFSKIRGQKVKASINKAVEIGVPFNSEGRVTISADNIVQYRPLKDVTPAQFQSYIRSISGAATKAAKSELTFDKPKN